MSDTATTSKALQPEAEAPHFTETLPSAPGAISGIASANAPVIYFEGAPFASVAEGVGRVTLTALREIAPSADGRGVAQDYLVVAHLRGSVPALKRLRKMIDDVLLHAETPEGVPN